MINWFVAMKKRWLRCCGLLLTAVALFTFLLPYSLQAQTAVPTRDRLAAPPTVPAPTQADEGAQLYWLHCQPCHGDIGQGLTDAPDDDWRAQYPEEDGNCWDAGCHGARPYEEGFTLPKQVPAVIGAEALTRFATAAEMTNFVQTAMPFQVPNSLTEEEYLQISAFLLRENNVSYEDTLTMQNIATIQLHATYNEEIAEATPTPGTVMNENNPNGTMNNTLNWSWLAGGVLIIMLGLGGLIWRRHTH